MGLLDNGIFQTTGLDNTGPLQTLNALSAARGQTAASVGSVPIGRPKEFNATPGQKQDSVPMPNFDMPDVGSAMDAGSARATSDARRSRDTSSESDATDGLLGMSPKVLDLARAMAPNSTDNGYALTRAGIGMMESGAHSGNFLESLAKGAGAGLDALQQQRALRANYALEQFKANSGAMLQQAQSRQADATAMSQLRQAFQGSYPVAIMAAKRSGKAVQITGPMGQPVWVDARGSLSPTDPGAGAPAAPMPGGAAPGEPPIPAMVDPTKGRPPFAGPPELGLIPPPPGSSPPQTAAAVAPPMPPQAAMPGLPPPGVAAPPPAASAPAKPFIPPGMSPDAWEALQMTSEIPGQTGDAARNQIIDLEKLDPELNARRAGMQARAESLAKAPFETVDTVSPNGGYIVTMPKDKWMKQQADALDHPLATPNAPKPPSQDIAPPDAPPMPKLDASVLNVHSVTPDAPDGGGFPVVPQGAAKPTAMTEQMFKDAGEAQKQWTVNSQKYGEASSRLRTLAQMYKLTETNQWNEAKSDVAANLAALSSTLGIPFKASKEFFGDPAAAQIAIKNATIAAFQQASQYTNRITNMELQGTTKSVAMPDLQPAATYDIITKGIAELEHGQAMQAGWTKAQKNGWNNPLAYEEAWYRANPVDAWNDSVRRRAGNFAGMPLPDQNDMNPNATYVTRTGVITKYNPETKKLKPIKSGYGDLAINPVPFD